MRNAISQHNTKIRPISLIVSILVFTTFALVAQAKTTKSGYLASPSQELLEEALSYVAAKDEVAYNKIMATGTVFALKGGLEVEIVDTVISKGLVKIRPRGETIELWTNTEAIGD
jgi:hypothetical protein